MSRRLPDGYQEVEYIKHIPSKAFVLGGFGSQEQAIQRIEQLQNDCCSSAYNIGANIKQIIQDYSIIIPEEAIIYLTDEERKRIEEFKKPFTMVEYTPTVYRFIDEKYVDSFFETGALRLSTFGRCAKLEDANRKDAAEGRALLIGNKKELRIEMAFGMGDNAILLCSSLSKNNIKANGQVDNCCIEIRNVNDFVLAITNVLLQDGHHVHTVLKGPCVYSDRKIETALNENAFEFITKEMPSNCSFDFGKLFQLGAEIAGDDIFFCKPNENRFENEYRMLWLLEEDIKQETYDVIVPDARQYCRKIKFNSTNQDVK